MAEQHENILNIIKDLPEKEQKIMMKAVYGLPEYEEIPVSAELQATADEKNFEVKGYVLPCPAEQMRDQRKIRIAAIQNQIVEPTTAPFRKQYESMRDRMEELIDAAAAMGANVICLQECWTTPFFPCTREKCWDELAFPAEYGEVADFCSRKAKEHHCVILSPILERDEAHEDQIWNTTVVFNINGICIGKSRKNHIPRVGE